MLLNEIFVSMQGEGPFVGTPAVFVRLAGCNLSCYFCDTDHEMRYDVTASIIADEIENIVGASKIDLVVITGGEPFLQVIGGLTRILVGLGYRVQIETNGVLYSPSFPFHLLAVTVVCSPKPNTAIHPILRRRISAWKYIVSATQLDDKGFPANCELPPVNVTELYFQPMDEKDTPANWLNQKEAFRLAKEHGGKVSVQLHKLLGMQ